MLPMKIPHETTWTQLKVIDTFHLMSKSGKGNDSRILSPNKWSPKAPFFFFYVSIPQSTFLNVGGARGEGFESLKPGFIAPSPIWGSWSHSQNLYIYRIEDKDFSENTEAGEHRIFNIGRHCKGPCDERKPVIGEKNYLASRRHALGLTHPR